MTISGFLFADSRPTIFVADPDLATCESIKAIADAMECACRTYASGQEFLDAFDEDRPGCLVLEIRIPGGNGLQIQKQLAEKGASLPLIFLTAAASVSVAVHAMRMGAVHFLEKPLRERELWSAMQEAIQIDARRRKARALERHVVDRLSTLSEREFAVLKLLADCKSKLAMAQELNVSVRTIEHHRTQLMRKLRTNSVAGLLRFALAIDNSPIRFLEKSLLVNQEYGTDGDGKRLDQGMDAVASPGSRPDQQSLSGLARWRNPR